MRHPPAEVHAQPGGARARIGGESVPAVMVEVGLWGCGSVRLHA